MMGAAIHPVRLVAAPELPAPPYPRDTKSKGWRFDIDVERLEQSDTWALAEPEVRPWLLMLWVTAWKQIPCGSYPADDKLIAARIGMRPALFTAQKETLLRGWWHANDGRIYHHVIAEQVLALVNWRTTEAERKAKQRAKLEAERLEKQRLSAECPTGQGWDSRGIPPGVRTPSPSPSPSPYPNTSTTDVVESAAAASLPASTQGQTKKQRGRKPSVSLGVDALLALGVPERVAADWLAVRKAPLTATALESIKSEASKAGMDLATAVEIAAAKGWRGFEADWVKPRTIQSAGGQRQQGRPHKNAGIAGALYLDHVMD